MPSKACQSYRPGVCARADCASACGDVTVVQMRHARLVFALASPTAAWAGDIGDAVEFAEPLMGEEVTEGLEHFIDKNPDEALSVLLGRYSNGTDVLDSHSLADLGVRRLSFAEVRPLVEAAASATGLPAALIDAVIRTESGYRADARSRVGALGLMQLMPGTAREVGVRDPLDPKQNVMGGARYLRKLYDKYGNYKLAIAAYNAGPGSVDKYRGIPPFAETRTYVRVVMARFGKSRLSGMSSDE
jgi:membrane-bound lytic murein transglycosylase MltF